MIIIYQKGGNRQDTCYPVRIANLAGDKIPLDPLCATTYTNKSSAFIVAVAVGVIAPPHPTRCEKMF